MNNERRYEQFFTMSVKTDLTEEHIRKFVQPLYEEDGFNKVYEVSQKKRCFLMSIL